MKPIVFIDDVDASANQTSSTFVVDCGQDMRFLIVIEKIGTDGSPKLFIEEDVDGVFVPLMDYDCEEIRDHFIIDDTPFGIRDSYFMGLRIEPNDNTAGTITAKMKVKTKSV